MNKRIRKKHVKRILNENLNIKHYSELFFTNPCKDCKMYYINDNYNCMSECQPIGKLTFNFRCKDLIKIIENLTGYNLNTYKFDVENNEFEKIEKTFKYIKYMLQDYYGIKDYIIYLNEETDKYTKEEKEFIQVKKID